MSRPEYALEIAQLSEEKETTLCDVFESVARKYLAHASEDEVVAQTRGRDSVFSAAIAADKMQLLRGQPTSITEAVDRDRISQLLEASLADYIDITPEP